MSSKIALILSFILFFCLNVFAEKIIKDTDFFCDAPMLVSVIRVNRFDDIKEFYQKSTNLMYTADFETYKHKSVIFNIDMTPFVNDNDSGESMYLGVKISRDLNGDIYVAGRTTAALTDEIKKYQGTTEKWSIIPRSGSAGRHCVEANGLLLSKNNNFLYAVYNGSYALGEKREIYKINKETGAYSLIYSTPVPAYTYALRSFGVITDDADNIYILSTLGSNKIALEKLNPSGTVIFRKEFAGSGNGDVVATDMKFLNNGNLFIVANDGYNSTAGNFMKNIIVVLDKHGNVMSNSVLNITKSGETQYYVDADSGGVYYSAVYTSLTSEENKEKGGMGRILYYNFQGQLIKTLYLPCRLKSTADIYSAYGWYVGRSFYGEYSGRYRYPLLAPFIENERLYMPLIRIHNSAGTEFAANKSYNVNLNNPLISLKFSEVADFQDSTIKPQYISTLNPNMKFRVKYKNFREKAPAAGFPRVHIYADGTAVPGSPFIMTSTAPNDIDYAKGIDYEVSVPLTCNAQTVYSYKFEVTDGNSFESDLYTIPSYLPKKPVSISANANGEKVGNTNVGLEWLCDTSSVTYSLQIAGPYDNPSNIYSWATKYTGSSTTYALAQLEKDKYYYWKVSAENFAGISEESDVFYFKTSDVLVPPVSVSANAKGETVSGPNVNLKWFCPTSNVTYSLKVAGPYDSPTNSYTWTEVYNGSDKSHHTVLSLENGKYYYWKVSAMDSYGDSEESEIFHFNNMNVQEKFYNAPNPFNPARGQQTKFVFNMNQTGTAKIVIYSEYGDKVWESGTYNLNGGISSEISYYGKDNSGRVLYNGTYIAVLTKKYGGHTKTEKCRILVIK